MDEKGYDSVEDWVHISETQLVKDMQFKEGHAKRFVRNTKEHLEATKKPSKKYKTDKLKLKGIKKPVKI